MQLIVSRELRMAGKAYHAVKFPDAPHRVVPSPTYWSFNSRCCVVCELERQVDDQKLPAHNLVMCTVSTGIQVLSDKLLGILFHRKD